MPRARLIVFVIALATFVGVSASPREEPALEPVTDPDAYAVYAAVLPSVWAMRSKDPLLLQQETEAVPNAERSTCLPRLAAESGWTTVVRNFLDANSHSPKRLQPMLPFPDVYRFISRAEIEADDARLALKYPGVWERDPESIEFAAVSPVGFNDDKTKAIVFVRLRMRGEWRFVTHVDGQWVTPALPFGCMGPIA